MAEAKVLVPAGMLGAGFTSEATRARHRARRRCHRHRRRVDRLGPAYLGSASPKMPAEAIAADLRLMIVHGAAAGIPVIVGSAGTSGTDTGVDWVAGIVEQIPKEEGLSLRVARIYSELHATRSPPRSRPADHAPRPGRRAHPRHLERCEHIVGLLGAEPFIAALDAGADVIIAGRSTDTAVIAAYPLRHGCPPGPSWHAAKTTECGGQCTTNPRGGGVLVDHRRRRIHRRAPRA